jgi:arylsulfatase A-like enzyme
MNRSISFVCVIALTCYSEGLSAESPDVDPKPPNIVFFLVDDYDKPETSVYGGNVLTPNLDRLAREGMTFTNAHVTSTVCTPSRYTCLTGRYAGASTSSVYLSECPSGTQGLPGFNVALEPDNMNVGHVLRDNGYATGFVGKYHVGPHIDEANAADFDWQWLAKNSEYNQEADRRQKHNHERARDLIGERGFSWDDNIYWATRRPRSRDTIPSGRLMRR